MPRYSLGIDYGTSSCRSLLIDLDDGAERLTSVFAYPSGVDGVVVSTTNPDLARQEPADYLAGLEAVAADVIAQATARIPGFRAVRHRVGRFRNHGFDADPGRRARRGPRPDAGVPRPTGCDGLVVEGSHRAPRGRRDHLDGVADAARVHPGVRRYLLGRVVLGQDLALLRERP